MGSLASTLQNWHQWESMLPGSKDIKNIEDTALPIRGPGVPKVSPPARRPPGLHTLTPALEVPSL